VERPSPLIKALQACLAVQDEVAPPAEAEPGCAAAAADAEEPEAPKGPEVGSQTATNGAAHWQTYANHNNVYNSVKTPKSSTEDVHYLGEFHTAQACGQAANASKVGVMHSWTWHGVDFPTWGTQCYGRTDRVWQGKGKGQAGVTSGWDHESDPALEILGCLERVGKLAEEAPNGGCDDCIDRIFQGNSALCLAWSHVGFSRAILRGATDPNQRCKIGSLSQASSVAIAADSGVIKTAAVTRTPLHHAVARGDVELVKAMLEHPETNPDVPDNLGLTALMTATRDGSAALVELLKSGGPVGKGAPPASTEAGTAPFVHYGLPTDRASLDQVYDLNASSKKQVRFLGTDAEASIMAIILTPSHSPLRSFEAIEWVMKVLPNQLSPERADLIASVMLQRRGEMDGWDADWPRVVGFAVSGGLHTSIGLLMKHRPALVNDPHIHPPLLVLASLANSTSIGALLLSVGADPNVGEGRTPLMYACAKGQFEYASQLLKAGADPNPKGVVTTPLMYAITNHDERLAKLLLEHKADPAVVNRDGFSVLQIKINDDNRRVFAVLGIRDAEADAEAGPIAAPVPAAVTTPPKDASVWALWALCPLLMFGPYMLHLRREKLTRAKYHALLLSVYTEHAPEKIKDIDTILKAYAGHEKDLEEALSKTYSKQSTKKMN
jgi:hypothetical protein